MANRNPYRLAEYPTRKSGTGCFIATAAYGTPFTNEINILRNWRDRWLLRRRVGRLFVKIYYTFSPPVASNIAKSEVKRAQTRRILKPIIKILSERYGND
tara:strand:+ start:2671 stop:2970 length:300 start_codon:yes stop_codon:yes gene_type:complete